MTTPSDYLERRKRVEALASGELPLTVYPIITVDRDSGEEQTVFDALAHAADLRLLLSAPPVTVEDVARAACDGWSNGNIQYDDCPAHHQDSWLEAGRAVLALFHTEGKT